MRKLTMLVALLAVGALAIATAVAFGDHGHGGGHHGNNFRAELNGYNEVVGGPGASTGSISTIVQRFPIAVSDAATSAPM